MSTFEHGDIAPVWPGETRWFPYTTWLSRTLDVYKWRSEGYYVDQCKSTSKHYHCSREPHPDYEPHIAVTSAHVNAPVRYLRHWFKDGEPNA